MKIDILTLFPKMFEGFLQESIIKRAIDKKIVEVNVINFRQFSKLKNQQVDDTPYGGGAGMVLMCEPIVLAIESLKTKDSIVILLTPQGTTYNQKLANQFASYKHIILICGHYEGFDERILSFVDMQISIGDYILTGGEIAAMAIVDSSIRLIDGVINKESVSNETFSEGLLDYPTYTKPRVFRGLEVPEVLLSGNHQAIAEYRKEQQLKKTSQSRPDLLKK